MKDDPTVQTAARIGHRFGTDPRGVIDGSYWDYAFLIACYEVSVEEENRANRKAQSKTDADTSVEVDDNLFAEDDSQYE